MRRKRLNTGIQVFLTCVAVGIATMFCAVSTANAFSVGETYDKSNADEVKELLPAPVWNWVKKGDFILKTGKINFEFNYEQAYIDLSNKNSGKYDLDANGNVIEKATGKIAEFIVGNPFPGKLDPNDPKVAEKVLANFKWTTYKSGTYRNSAAVEWIGRGGKERYVDAAAQFMPYQNIKGGPLPNPNNFLYQQATFVVKPMDLRGTVTMNWTYNNDDPDTAFAYVPMLRRIRRISATSRSDPFLGSDFCTDDSYLWTGKNSSMNWKFIREATILAPFTSPEIITIEEKPNGTLIRKFPTFKIGYQVAGWKGAPWAPVDLTWTPRKVWVVEATPKDPYYNYGRMIYYIDQQCYFPYFKENYDRSNAYWKTVFMHTSMQVSKSGRNIIPQADGYAAVDDKMDHACYARLEYIPELESDKVDVPLSEMGPEKFTVSSLQQMTK